MKVRLEGDYKRVYTLEQLDQAKEVIRRAKDDTSRPEEYGEMAIRAILSQMGSNDCILRILFGEAHTAKNSKNDYERMGEGTGIMDIWITTYAETCDGFIRVGAYLSDIWDETVRIDNAFVKYGKA